MNRKICALQNSRPRVGVVNPSHFNCPRQLRLSGVVAANAVFMEWAQQRTDLCIRLYPDLTMATRDTGSQKRDDPCSAKDLVQLALTEADEDAAWVPVTILHFRADKEVLETARALCLSSRAQERKLGVDVLGQLGIPDRAFPEECFQILSKTLAAEADPLVLEAIGIALGHLKDPRAPELLATLSNHSSADVRLGVVYGISGLESQEAVKLLIRLSSDEDDAVRDWATFGLGSMTDFDSAELRAALMERITDANDEARLEALLGLARRKDVRVIEPLIEELTSENVGLLALEAAEEAADFRLLPPLLLLKESWIDDKDRHTERLERALQSCS
jgi:HEAT repeat protein